ncbi:DNA mismatch repair endonuclease MutL [Brumicola nitratireducens]|uniref:DNA mismatch repair protein MutL n=1 Tax=Glaciecola nitratireducens (strain JCM 12485 / KCTC 12276 / FR1064) TaxID=1085623 RepID=G4QJ95_GLANF|nr:DNA mismatch repair endonuclease MutL [Glaciecola nitratireducens]AEP31238.1 DNA mismatch repair protein [Glaciecola nitratireducens FR1064]
MTIKILPARLANQIAAGEVVERPASVIKELVENSIDAGATDILVEIDKGGHKRMLIRDNGKGIPREELSLALSRHATSKIEDIDDLESITSLGFRGEALASISSVSRLTLTSKTEEQAEAWQAHCEGREMEIQLNPAAHPKGASVEVLDLFFNTPARRKFLRAEKTEFQHVEEIFKRIALSHFEVGFTLKHNGRVVHRFPAVVPELKDKRIAAVCGQAFLQNSIAVHGEYQNVTVTGWCNAVGQGRGTNELQYSFVNGRMMKDRVILHAIRQAFEGMIDSQTYPAFVLFITMPPEELDINVHPAKHEVRFHQSRQVHDLIYKSVSDALLLSASTDALEFENEDDAESISSNVTSLYEVPKHAYQQPDDRRSGSDASNTRVPNTDYIAPLRLGPNAKGFESKGSQGTSFQGKAYHGVGQVSKSAASSYQNLMSAGSDSSNRTATSADAVFPFLLSDSKQLVFVQGQAVRFLPAYHVPAQVLYEQIQASGVQQPLLMPVSVKQEVTGTKLGPDSEKTQETLQSRLKVLEELGFDIQSNVGKWILKQVPACLRQLPWVSILPKLLDTEHTLLTGKAVVHYICFCWAQSHEFTYAELQNWFQAMPQTQQAQLIKQFSQTLDIPALSFSLGEN